MLLASLRPVCWQPVASSWPHSVFRLTVCGHKHPAPLKSSLWLNSPAQLLHFTPSPYWS